MNREQKCLLAIERGYIYCPETGYVFNKKGKRLTNITKTGYPTFLITINYKRFQLLQHQFAWYWVNNSIVEQIDHINGIRHDNRIYNLRAVSPLHNQWNRTNVKGYRLCKKTNKFVAQICVNYVKISLGYFSSEEEAHKAYLKAKEKHHKI